jgi:signal transduction histidine kinase
MSISAHEHSALLSLAVHEFRTPLTVVAGYTKMLMNEQLGPLSDRQRQVLAEVEQQCKRLSSLLYEMSALADLADPDTPPRLHDEIPLPALLEEVTRGLEGGDNGSVAVVQGPNPHPLTVRGDRKGLTSALAALIKAVVREQGGAARVSVGARPRQHDGQPVAAIAIGREDAVDEAHEGGPNARFNEYPGGIGLGLPIARRVIEQAGGRIWSSAEGRHLGVVTVLLPLKESFS